MAYKALYRSYRPNTFEEVAGQEYIIKTLKHALINKRTSHAYIFSGPRGIGKTTIARLFAKALNCKNLIEGEPCNECSSCESIINNETTDIIELDAASNNGVDEIRAILEKVNFLPSTLRFKVYIIDEVHMLSMSAFNALLKTLEEPPAHVVFILATTEPHKVPMTILSRCQRFDFKPLNNKEIINTLQRIAKSEDIEIENEALQAIAEVSEGGMRDAIGVLDQVSSYSDGYITVEDVNSVTGRIATTKILELMQKLNDNDAGSSIRLVNDLLNAGKEVGRLVQSLLQLCRDMLLYQSVGQEEMQRPIFENELFKELASSFEKRKLFYFTDILNEVQNKIRYTVSQRIYLEVGVMKMATSTREDYATITNNDNPDSANFLAGEFEDQINSLEGRINKLKQDVIKYAIPEFKEETRGKIAFLENVSSKFVNLPSDLEERVEKLEENTIVHNDENIMHVDERLVELQNQIDTIRTATNVEIASVTLENIEKRLLSLELEEKTFVANDNTENDSNLINRIGELEELSHLVLAQFDEVSVRVKELENKNSTIELETTEPNLFNVNDENEINEIKANYALLDSRITEINNVTTQLKNDIQSFSNNNAVDTELSNTVLNLVNQLEELNISSEELTQRLETIESKVKENYKEIQKRPNPFGRESEELKIEVEKKELVENVIVKEEPPKVIEPMVLIKEEKEMPVIRKVEEKPLQEQQVSKFSDDTAKVYDIRVIEDILHQSRMPATREEKQRILAMWSHLGDRVGTSLYSIARQLMDGMFVVNGETHLIIVYSNATLCNHIMSEKVHFDAKQILKIALGRDYDFIALPENTWQEKRNEYHGQYNMGIKYPKLKPINNPELRVINIIKDNFVTNKSESYMKAEELFGKNLIKEEN